MDQWIPVNMDVEPGAFVLPLVDFATVGGSWRGAAR
jgi:hypothetical protein